jgi:hypothetical protein
MELRAAKPKRFGTADAAVNHRILTRRRFSGQKELSIETQQRSHECAIAL